jgi:L-ascorbate metabolism protein UlaG (beta-lactamase superfamily)
MSRFPISDHCDGTRFFTPGAPPLKNFSDVLRWRFSRRVADWTPLTITPLSAPASPPANAPEVIATWINHSTFLLQFAGISLLTDPVYSERVGLFGRIGPRRVHAPGIRFETLPKIDAILLSHDHYDHCDLPTLRHLVRAYDPVIIAPLGFRALLRPTGSTRLVELDWWQSHALTPPADSGSAIHPSRSTFHTPATAAAAATITLTPAQHWSNRVTGPRCGRLWGGYFLNTSARRVFFAGDTGYHPTIFRDIAARLAPPDLALLPIGAYEPRWFMRDQHVNPAEAVQIHQDLGARLSLGMHWGTFQLTDEPRLDPPAALRNSLEITGLSPDSFQVMEPGQSRTV